MILIPPIDALLLTRTDLALGPSKKSPTAASRVRPRTARSRVVRLEAPADFGETYFSFA
jgi:hypothetical protein